MELSPRELEIAEAIHAGRSRKAIAHDLGISSGSLQNHIQSTFNKLGISKNTELVLWVERGKVGIRS